VLSHFKPDGDPTPLPPAVVALPDEELPFLRPGLHHTVTTGPEVLNCAALALARIHRPGSVIMTMVVILSLVV